MGWDKGKRPFMAITPGSNSASGGDADRVSTARIDYEHCSIIQTTTFSSSGVTIGPRGVYALKGSTSAAAANTTTAYYLATPTSGDLIEVDVLYASTSMVIQLRTAASGNTFIGSTATNDAVNFTVSGQSVYLRALSSAQWLFEGTTTLLGASST